MSGIIKDKRVRYLRAEMSSDPYALTIQSVNGPVLELRVRTTGAGGPTDYACTRSFVLATLMETDTRPLHKAVEAIGDSWFSDEDDVEQHIGKFITSVEFSDRRNTEIDEGSLQEWTEAVAGEGLSGKQAEDRLCERHHNFVLRATFTDAAHLEGYQAGQVLHSSAYDVWWDDPTRASV